MAVTITIQLQSNRRRRCWWCDPPCCWFSPSGWEQDLEWVLDLVTMMYDDNDATDAAFHPPMLFIIRLHQVWRWGGKDQLWLQAASQICHLNGWTKVSCLSPIKTNCYIKRGEHPKVLESAYLSCLNLMKEHNLRSIAFPCISTGVYGYPQVASICQHITFTK